jgi:hypothetical protein
LGIIEHNERELVYGKGKKRISLGALNRITMTATRGKANRTSVEHDVKAAFPRSSASDLAECASTATMAYNSYLALRAMKGRYASRPCKTNASGRMPRWMFHPRSFKLVHDENTTARWWLSLRDSLDAVQEGRWRHDTLMIPLKISPFHENQLEQGEIRVAQLFQDSDKKWWIAISVQLPEVSLEENNLPPAVLGIDLGIMKAVCTTLVTPKKVRETRYFTQKKKARLIKHYDNRVANLQSDMRNRKESGKRYDGVAFKLRELKNKRENVSKELDRVLLRI